MELKQQTRALWGNSNDAHRQLWQLLHNPRIYPNLHRQPSIQHSESNILVPHHIEIAPWAGRIDIDLKYFANKYHQNALSAEILMIKVFSRWQFKRYEFKRLLCDQPCTVEFICTELNLIVELYSEFELPNFTSETRVRSFEDLGFQVARFSHSEILSNTDGVIESLIAIVKQSHKNLMLSQIACRYLAGDFGKIRQTVLCHDRMP